MMITCAQSPARSARLVGFTGSAPQVRTSWSLGCMRRERVKELHYITDVANLASIMRLGIPSHESRRRPRRSSPDRQTATLHVGTAYTAPAVSAETHGERTRK